MHLWFVGKQRDQKALQANHEMIPQRPADADAMVENHGHPLGDKPVVDVDTLGSAGLELQKILLSISTNSQGVARGQERAFRHR